MPWCLDAHTASASIEMARGFGADPLKFAFPVILPSSPVGFQTGPADSGGGMGRQGGSMGTGKLWVAALAMVVALAGTAAAQTVEIEYWQYTFPQRVQAIDELTDIDQTKALVNRVLTACLRVRGTITAFALGSQRF